MSLLQDAVAALQQGNKAEARRLAEQVIATEPASEAAWGVMMYTATTPAELQTAVQQILAINPQNPAALQFQAQLAAMPAPEPATPVAEPVPVPVEPAEEAPPKSYRKEDGTRVEELGTYQMLWDCEFCDTKKLLGVTHRFCPNCGSAQNPKKRYFPADSEKIAVKDHVYYGADLICPSCNTANSGRAEFCGQCGTPLTEAARATRLADQSRGAGEAFTEGIAADLVKERFEANTRAATLPDKKTSRRWLIALTAGVSGCFILCLVAVAVLVFGNKDVTVVVAGHNWERQIEIQSFEARSDGDWCDSMPSGAYNVSRSERQRSTRQIPDGETCRTVRTDNGDGTFSERRECTTNYRSEPVYDTYCSYTINRWDFERYVTSSGNRLEEPYWGEVNLACTGERLGCERQTSDPEETYNVIFRDPASDDEYECDYDLNQWRTFTLESRWIMSINITGVPWCDSVKAP